MTCVDCAKTNLPGGVRCIFCGTHYDVAPDFELDFQTAVVAESPTTTIATPTAAPASGPRVGIVGALLLILFKAKYLLTLLKFGPLLTTFGSMYIFISAQALLLGWQLA